MRNNNSEQPFHLDSLLLVVCASILVIGYVMVSSASLHLGAKTANSIMHYPLRQLIHIVLGLVVARIVVGIPMEKWEQYSVPLFLGSLVLLLVVMIPGIGIRVNGSVRWLSVFGLRIQVSEVTKACSVLFMAGYVTRHLKHVQQSPFGVVKPLAVFMAASALLLLEPDFGSSVVILIIALGILFLAGAKLVQFTFLFGLVASLAAVMVTLSPYRLRRVTSFLDPWADPLNTGFQLSQALISFGRGEWTGVGLGGGVQKLFYLPEAHTDFLFSVIAEELGLMGVVTIVALFSMLIWRAFQIAQMAEKAEQTFSAYTAYGLGIWFGFQTFVNIGVNMGILPTKGLTLPLMSYGGGSMIVMCASIALLFRIHSEAFEHRASTPKGFGQWRSA